MQIYKIGCNKVCNGAWEVTGSGLVATSIEVTQIENDNCKALVEAERIVFPIKLMITSGQRKGKGKMLEV